MRRTFTLLLGCALLAAACEGPAQTHTDAAPPDECPDFDVEDCELDGASPSEDPDRDDVGDGGLGDAASHTTDSDAGEPMDMDASAPTDAHTSSDGSVASDLDGDAQDDSAQLLDAAPDATAPDATAPDATAPDATAPDAAVHDAHADAPEAAAGDASADASVEPPPLSTELCGGPTPTWDVLLNAGASGARFAIDGDHLLSGEVGGGWTLWQPSTGRQIASGEAKLTWRNNGPGGAIDLVGGTFITSRDDVKVEIRAATDGRVLAVFDMTYIENVSWGEGKLPRLSNDASYVWQQTAWGLKAWSLGGELLFQRSGNYTYAKVFAGPNELRVAEGPAGANVVERVAMDGTAETAATFVGTFGSFFDDSAWFLTYDDTGRTVYSPDGVLEQRIATTGQPVAWGQGDLVAIGASVYHVGEPQPIATYDMGLSVLWPLRPHGMRGYYSIGNELKILSLLGVDPSVTTYQLPTWAFGLPDFATSPTGSWVTGYEGQTLWGGGNGAPLAALGCGPIRAVAGSSSGHVAVATNDGLVRVFHLDGVAPSLVRVIAAPSADLTLSSAGTELLSVGDTLRLYRLPGGELIYEAPRPHAWALAAGAERIAQVVCSDGVNCSLTISDFSGQQVIPAPIPFVKGDPATFAQVALSPDGRGAAVLHGTDLSTTLYRDGVSVGQAAAGLHGWLGDAALLLQTKQPTAFGYPVVTNAIGEPQRTLTVPTYIWFRPIDASRFYNAYSDAVYSSEDGQLVWQGDAPASARIGRKPADVAGRYRAAVLTNRVRLTQWR